MKNYKIIAFCLGLLFVFNVGIQAQSNKWKSFLAYQNATLVEATPNHIFAVYDGSLLMYSPEDEEVRTLSLENGLHDTDIQLIKYHAGMKCLIIVYGSWNIDLFYNPYDITNIPDLKNKTGITDKTVNNIDVIDDYAYLSGAFGVAVLDLGRREMKGDFKWNTNVNSVCAWNGFLYAATADGLLKADPSSNLLDRDNWKEQKLEFENSANNKQITQMLVFKDYLICGTQNLSAWVVSKDYSVKNLYVMFKKMLLLNDQLVLIRQNGQINFHTDISQKTTIFNMFVNDISSNKEGFYWLAYGEEGLTGILKEKDSDKFDIDIPGIKVNSPIRNSIFFLSYTHNKLLVTGGDRDSDRKNNPGTFMVYENNKWYNMDDQVMTEAIRQQTGIDRLVCRDFMSAVVDPRDLDHYYVASWGEGVYELKMKDSKLDFIKLYNNDNSALGSSLPNFRPQEYVRVDGLVYDNNNNLYMTNSEVANAVVVLKNNNTWGSFGDPQVAIGWTNQLIITKNKWKWGNLFRDTKVGIFAYNDNNTIDNKADDTWFFSKSFVDQTGRNFAPATYSCLAEDMNGVVWVGTDNGPIYFSSATQVKNGLCNRMIGTDPYGQGYYVLDGIKINAIAVDGGNRKWMGTEGNGLFMIDQSGGELVVTNFTTKNSSILSDKVISLAINQKSGEIFIGTENGLCSYMGDAIEGKSDYSNVYAYPNPVYPLRKSEVVITGLMQNSTVKITDMAGNLIKEATSIGGQYTWDCTDVDREIVKAGIYLVFAINSDGSQGGMTKIMVIQ